MQNLSGPEGSSRGVAKLYFALYHFRGFKDIMRVLAVLAHPVASSTSGRLFYEAVKALQQQGATVDVLDLYQRAEQIPFLKFPEPGKSFDSVFADIPFYWENKERFMAADRLLIAYPVWWYAVPAIMKAWLDLITNYAWVHHKGAYATAKHNIKKVLIVNTADMSWWHRILHSKNSATEMVVESCKYIGISAIMVHEVNKARKLGPHDKERHVQKVLRLCDWLLQ